MEARLRRVAGKLVEQLRHILPHHRVAGEQAEIGVLARGLRIVVAGAHVAVAGEAVRLLTNDERELAVRLQPDNAVDDVYAGAFELARPRNVRILVEARLEFDEREHLLAGLCGVDERVDDRRVARRAVERLLDGEHLRVGGRLREERLHRRRERVVRVMQQNVALADRGEDVLRAARLDLGDLPVRRRHEGREFQVRPVDAAEFEEHGGVERRRQTVHLVRRHAHLVRKQLGEERRRLIGDLQADRRSETAAQQFLLDRVEQILGVVFLHLDIFVSGDAEGARLLDDHAREQRLQMCDDQILHCDEAVADVLRLVFGHVVDGNETVEIVGNLHSCEVGLAGGRVLHEHGEIDRTAGNIGEGVRRVHRERREHWEDLLAEVAGEALLLGDRELVPAEQLDVLLGEFGQDRVDDVMRMLVLQAVRLLGDCAHLLAWAQSARARHGDAGVDAALETGDTDHEELVEIAGEDRREARAFDDRNRLVLREFEHAFVEFEPAELAVEEAVGWQRELALHVLPLVAFVRFGDMFGNLAAQNRLRWCVENL